MRSLQIFAVDRAADFPQVQISDRVVDIPAVVQRQVTFQFFIVAETKAPESTDATACE